MHLSFFSKLYCNKCNFIEIIQKIKYLLVIKRQNQDLFIEEMFSNSVCYKSNTSRSLKATKTYPPVKKLKYYTLDSLYATYTEV